MNAVAIQPDAKIVLAGNRFLPGAVIQSFAVGCYLPNGRPDQSFGRHGLVTTPLRGDGSAEAVVIGSDGRIVAAGYGEAAGDFLLTRYDGDGRLDPSFGHHGKVSTHFAGGGSVGAVTIQRDGKIVAAGSSGSDNASSGRLLIVRYLQNGRLDHTFGAPADR